METGLTKQQIITQLLRSPHGKLEEYVPVGTQATKDDPEFMAHLIAYNEVRGQIRDSKVALPVVSLSKEFLFEENSLAHLALLDPRNFVRALKFAKSLPNKPQRELARLVDRYLRVREATPGWWERTALQHRASMKTLYALYHVKPDRAADRILFKGKYPAGSLFAAVRDLKDMSATEAAGTILTRRIPFLIAVSALGGKAKDTDLVLALIERMSPTELVTNTKMLERLGIKDVPALRGAYEAGLQRVATSKKATFKTTRAVEAISDPKLKAKLAGAQEKQLAKLGGIEGDWLVLGDKSASMADAIETAKLVAGTLARMVKGQVMLVFFNTSPTAYDVTGKTYEEVKALTKNVVANGATSIGCGLAYAREKNFEPSGIAIASDGAENSVPWFTAQYEALCKSMDREVPVYLYWTKCYQSNATNNNPGTLGRNMHAAGHDMQVFDLREGTDYYALPNLVQTMRASRYSLIDEILATPLLTLDEVFKQKGKETEDVQQSAEPVAG
jgi:hypothetical protein